MTLAPLIPILAAAVLAAEGSRPGLRQAALKTVDAQGRGVILGVLRADFGDGPDSAKAAEKWEKKIKGREPEGADELTVDGRWVFRLPAPVLCLNNLPPAPTRLIVRFEEQRDPYEIDVTGWRNLCFLVGRAGSDPKVAFRPIAVFREVKNVSVAADALERFRKANPDADRQGKFDVAGARKGRFFRDLVHAAESGLKVYGGYWLAATGSRSNVGIRMLYPAPSAKLAEDFAERTLKSLKERSKTRSWWVDLLRRLG